MEKYQYNASGAHLIPSLSSLEITRAASQPAKAVMTSAEPICCDPQPAAASVDDKPLGMAYVPMQQSIYPMYSPQDGLPRGTIFKQLDLPWKGVKRCDG